VRLFLGGLPGDAAESELRGLLGAFGEVLSVDIVPQRRTPGRPPAPLGVDAVCRGFAYVSLQPKSGKELRRCLSLVSCRWGTCRHCSAQEWRNPVGTVQHIVRGAKHVMEHVLRWHASTF